VSEKQLAQISDKVIRHARRVQRALGSGHSELGFGGERLEFRRVMLERRVKTQS